VLADVHGESTLVLFYKWIDHGLLRGLIGSGDIIGGARGQSHVDGAGAGRQPHEQEVGVCGASSPHLQRQGRLCQQRTEHGAQPPKKPKALRERPRSRHLPSEAAGNPSQSGRHLDFAEVKLSVPYNVIWIY
jgi:hypothetical protein